MEHASNIPSQVEAPSKRDLGETAPYLTIVGVGVFLFWYCGTRPAQAPWIAPWDFSPIEYACASLSLLWFCKGLARSTPAERPRVWRRVAFFVGLAAIWAVMQTRYDYLAQHMFFLNRIQHVVMHHLGPFLIALGSAGPTIRKGMPRLFARVVESRPVAVALSIVQQPFLAAFLFVGLVVFWLIPPIHFRAMIDARLYAVMNWSMVVDGLLFWTLVLDERPKPPARLSFGARAALSFGVMFPQIAIGAVVAFAGYDLYPYYDLCGRVFPSITALQDQEIAGIVLWIPPAMMSVLGVLLVLNALRLHEDSLDAVAEDRTRVAAMSSAWTGR